MAKREFSGEPIDLTNGPGESHLSQANGETVDGTTEDDYHSEETEAWPSALDRENYSPTEQKAIEQLSIQPDLLYSEVADKVGCSDALVYQARQKIINAGKADQVRFEVSREDQVEPPVKRTTTEETDKGEQKDQQQDRNIELTERQQWFIEQIGENPDASKTEIESLIPEDKDWGGQGYYNIMQRSPESVKRSIVEKDNWDQAEGYIRNKLEGIDVDVTTERQDTQTEDTVETGEQPTPETTEGSQEDTDRVEKLEETIAELTQVLIRDATDKNIAEDIVRETQVEAVATGAMRVVLDE